MSPRPSAAPRLRRVLAIVPWIAQHPGSAVSDIAARFGLTEAQLVRDLELLPLCGLPPYTPDRLIDVEIAEGRVRIRFAEYLHRPVRLTAPEGFALLATGRAMLGVLGQDSRSPLATALDKLEVALGTAGTMDVQVENATHVQVLRDAADAHEQVEIDYYSFGRDARTTRSIEPWRVHYSAGHWYVDAYCHLAEDERQFRVDRVEAVRRLNRRFEHSDAIRELGAFEADAAHPRVVLELSDEAAWVVETYPCEDVQRLDDGRWRVTLAISESAWLARVLLRLGPHAHVVEPAAWRGLAATTARRLLARYRATPAAP